MIVIDKHKILWYNVNNAQYKRCLYSISYFYMKGVNHMDISKLEQDILNIIHNANSEVATENSNKNANLISTQRDYVAGEVSKHLSKEMFFSPKAIELHNKGVIHIHDMDYALHPMLNCCLVNLEDMLQNGTNINGVHIDKPKSLSTACTLTSQISLVVSGSQFGGQTVNLGHLAPFVDISRQKERQRLRDNREMLSLFLPDADIDRLAEEAVKKEIRDSVQTLNYQWNTMSSSNGQTPFISLFMYLNEIDDLQTKHDLALLIEEVLKQRIQGVKNEDGAYVSQTFPKLLYVLEEDNIHEDSKYYYLTELAGVCTAKRMVPDYLSEKMMLKHKVNSKGEGRVIAPMGCRSMLSVLDDNPDHIWGRANLGVVTLNLPYIALESKGDMNKFWSLLGEYLSVVHDAQMARYIKLLGTKAKVTPTLWQYGAYTRLDAEDTIDKYLTKDNCTISLGYAGIQEVVKFFTGQDFAPDNEEGALLGHLILRVLNTMCETWKRQDDLGWAVYGTPLESCTEKFAKACLRDFGTVDGERKKNYVTNSHHIHVTKDVDAFSKLTFESEYQIQSTGGTITYVEVPNLQHNTLAVMSIIKHIYETCLYAEINCKSDYCFECGYDGEMQPHTGAGRKKGWICPSCGNTDTKTISVVRRTCGYLGSNSAGDIGWTEGRYDEIVDRVLHL